MHGFYPEELYLYSQCPNKYSYSVSNSIPIPKYNWPKYKQLVIECIKILYSRESKQFYAQATWEWLRKQVNKIAFQDVDISNQDSFDAAYEAAQKAIEILHNWYYNFFITSLDNGLVNLMIPTQIGDSVLYTTLDLVLLSSEHKVIPVIFTDNKELKLVTYKNDLLKKLPLWALWKETGIYSKKLMEVSIMEKTIDIKMHNNNGKPEDIDDAVSLMVLAMQKNIHYPSPSESCKECPFKNICAI